MVRLPPPVWGLIFVLVGLGLSWALGWPMAPLLPQPIAGAALFVLAWIVPVWAVMLFRKAGAEVSPTSPQNRALVTGGPFAVTRNPMYLGLLVSTLGVAIFVGAWPMFLVPIAVFLTANFVHIPFEEAKMRRQFGAEFDAYVDRVRRWL